MVSQVSVLSSTAPALWRNFDEFSFGMVSPANVLIGENEPFLLKAWKGRGGQVVIDAVRATGVRRALHQDGVLLAESLGT